MNRLVLGFGLSLFLFFNLPTNAQENRTSGDDASAVGVTVTNYIEAYYTGDARRMEQTLHPHYLHGASAADGKGYCAGRCGEHRVR